MKKVILFASVFVLTEAYSQNRSINFEHGDLASVFAKAKKENKLIMVDAYTSWCGPCKAMAKNVFTNDSVADYYNTNFVNYKLDMEKGEGPAFANKYQVQCYPNLLVINADGELKNRSAGYMAANEFIDLGKNSSVKDKNFVDLKNKYEKDGLNADNVLEYFNLLSGSCLSAGPLVASYIASVKEEDLAKPNNWKLLADAVEDHNSREMRYLFSHVADFEKSVGKTEVERKVLNLGNNYFGPIVFAQKFDKATYEKARGEFVAAKWPYSDKVLFNADLQAASRTDKDAFFDLAAAKYLQFNNDNPNALNGMAWDIYEKSNKKEHVDAAVKMAKRACEIAEEYAFLDTYAAVLYKSGNMKEAAKAATKAIEKAKADKLDPNDYRATVELQKNIMAATK